ncbi:sulfite reductase subunit alpha [Variovorax sp.]|uniref:sulfite reductase subunit alpha n=1 Tax=Variovorax sp. TaxID=1871043 RepID=UPI002D57A99F|nr:sulfite reductase subunit alpha [Variovorax sp.]HYP81735.1 sulfite reductase subunit alpha [Variovorax sp.]
MSEYQWRAVAAAATLLAYAAMCSAIFWRLRRRRRQDAATAAALAGDGDRPATLVLHASQTGQALALAWQTAGWLAEGGEPVRVLPLNAVGADDLRQARRALFIASTYGEGDPPDGASVFAESVMDSAHADAWPALHYAVLALGDRQYRHFCGFGRRLDDWLAARGAQPERARIEVDNADPAALAQWRQLVRRSPGGPDDATPETSAASASPKLAWRLAARELLNAGSAGAPVFLLSLVPRAGDSLPEWRSGDLARLHLQADPGRPRDYSIASLPAEGSLQLMVRQERHPDGQLGAASGLLGTLLPIGGEVQLQLRPHHGFRLQGNDDRPLVLIGNGTGLAGLRSHLRHCAASGRHGHWLMFGERNAQHDRLLGSEIDGWLQAGVLARMDWVFSRDQEERRYVQHRLLTAGDELLRWLERGAAIYVCGSLQGMAQGVDAALRQIAGDDLVRELLRSGRYRRDVY